MTHYDDGRNDIKAEGFRPLRFNFGGDGGPFSEVFQGFTDDSTWNGWLNCWVTVEEYRTKIRPIFKPQVEMDEATQDLDYMAEQAEKFLAENPDAETDPRAWVSLACCYTTCEVPCWLCEVETDIFESEACFDCYTWLESVPFKITWGKDEDFLRRMYISHLYRENKKLKARLR